jgi:hypothetical protein
VKYCTPPEREHINEEIQISDVAVTNPELKVSYGRDKNNLNLAERG